MEQLDEFYLKELIWTSIPNKELLKWVEDKKSKNPLIDIAKFGLSYLNDVLYVLPYPDGITVGFRTQFAKSLFAIKFLKKMNDE